MPQASREPNRATRRLYRLALAFVIYMFLHLLPFFPIPTRPLKTALPDARWESLAFYDPPIEFVLPWFAHAFGCLRQPGMVIPVYEASLVLIAGVISCLLPLRWFYGRP
jgi:hypothetical protein